MKHGTDFLQTLDLVILGYQLHNAECNHYGRIQSGEVCRQCEVTLGSDLILHQLSTPIDQSALKRPTKSIDTIR